MTVAVANGTVLEINQSNPHLMRAWAVSVGRLGVLLDVTLKISLNVNVRRTSRALSSSAFVQRMKEVQRAFNLNGESAQAVQELGETQVLPPWVQALY
jgi:hypothetical protein